MTEDPFEAALAGFQQWTATTQRKLSADPVGEVETLLDLMRDYLDIESPADLGEGDLKELLLSIYPRKITVFDAADTADTIPAVRDFLAYLAERGEIPEGTVRALERELDEIAPRFTEVMLDPSNWGMAGSLVRAMAADGVDLDDQAAVDRWIAGYNARLARSGDEEEDGDDDFVDLKEAFGLPDQMAPLRLPDPSDLAALARRAPLMAQLRKLAWWLGAGRAVTEDEELAGGDAAEAAAELGVEGARLPQLWWMALDAVFIELDEDETHAIPGESAEAWDEADDDEVLDLWEMVFALVIGDALDDAASLDPDRSGDLEFSGHGAALAVTLFLARPDGLRVAEVSEVIRAAATDELPPAQAEKAWQSWVLEHGDPARLLLDLMAELEAIRDNRRRRRPRGPADPAGTGRGPHAACRIRGGDPAASGRRAHDRGAADRHGRRRVRGRVHCRDRRLAVAPDRGARGQGTAGCRRRIRSGVAPPRGRCRGYRTRCTRRARVA